MVRLVCLLYDPNINKMVAHTIVPLSECSMATSFMEIGSPSAMIKSMKMTLIVDMQIPPAYTEVLVGVTGNNTAKIGMILRDTNVMGNIIHLVYTSSENTQILLAPNKYAFINDAQVTLPNIRSGVIEMTCI